MAASTADTAKATLSGNRRASQGAVRAWIYDRAILSLTAGWYAEVLGRVPERARLLDVGIGTGGALVANADLVRSRRLRIHGIDVDAA